jgi:hypothetical protein
LTVVSLRPSKRLKQHQSIARDSSPLTPPHEAIVESRTHPSTPPFNAANHQELTYHARQSAVTTSAGNDDPTFNRGDLYQSQGSVSSTSGLPASDLSRQPPNVLSPIRTEESPRNLPTVHNDTAEGYLGDTSRFTVQNFHSTVRMRRSCTREKRIKFLTSLRQNYNRVSPKPILNTVIHGAPSSTGMVLSAI